MTKPISKMTKKDLKNKIIQMDEELSECERHASMMAGFIQQINLWDIFVKTMEKDIEEGEKRTFVLDEIKEAVNQLQCTCCSKGCEHLTNPMAHCNVSLWHPPQETHQES